MQTNEMSLALRERLVQLGWNPERVTWGRRVNGDMHGVTLERNGVEKYHPGPFSAVRVGDQSAIVRWG
jgi:hypothetical protein